MKDLEGQVQQLEDDNNVLRNFNEHFGVENDKLIAENDQLKAELARYQQLRIPRSILQQGQYSVAPGPTSAQRLIMDKPASPNEANAAEARVRIFFNS